MPRSEPIRSESRLVDCLPKILVRKTFSHTKRFPHDLGASHPRWCRCSWKALACWWSWRSPGARDCTISLWFLGTDNSGRFWQTARSRPAILLLWSPILWGTVILQSPSRCRSPKRHQRQCWPCIQLLPRKGKWKLKIRESYSVFSLNALCFRRVLHRLEVYEWMTNQSTAVLFGIFYFMGGFFLYRFLS